MEAACGSDGVGNDGLGNGGQISWCLVVPDGTVELDVPRRRVHDARWLVDYNTAVAAMKCCGSASTIQLEPCAALWPVGREDRCATLWMKILLIFGLRR
jgi:hypothetical protein